MEGAVAINVTKQCGRTGGGNQEQFSLQEVCKDMKVAQAVEPMDNNIYEYIEASFICEDVRFDD